ncbi:ABC transporter [Mycobacterium sp. CVI_P3]|uniref:ABC transporter n=1 Tax=Mycobacterium pinniadriaticum TaxID=2994102 RepID=A0ABT3SDH4_9MYCO|nr:ABC transporter [Mycobacterium pinniadriaticum]MCX2930759.1 ABC transporter [Mycobacterium pinniadriaticum]MCX2937183.1 ABC transporter [Mycobacterium pinniadriaticum]
MTAITRPTGGRHHNTAAESSLTGVGALVRFALRRDRGRLAMWISALTLMMVYTPNALKLAFPSEAQRQARVDLLKTPAGIMLGGPSFGGDETNLGVMMANELTLTLIVAASILAILTVVRHTRAEEESGAAELVLSSTVGRHSRTAAALILIAMVNAVLTVTLTIAMAANGFAVVDTAAMCLGVTAVATAFGALAALSAQLWRQARTVTGATLATLAAAVLVRGAGDVIDHSGSILSWFSPIAWAQQMRPFVALRWWPLVLLGVLVVAVVVTTVALEGRRQYDDGVLASSGARSQARPVGGVFGLQLVLQRGLTTGWAIGLFVGGAVFGSMSKALQDAASGNKLLARVLSTHGTDGLYTTMTQFLAAATTAYVVNVVVRLNRDEESGIGETVLAGAASRWTWLLSTVGAALTGATVLLACAGVGNGVGAALTMGEPQLIGRLTAAALAFLPAMAVMASVAAVGVALRRPGIGWLAVTFVVVALYLGALLRLPGWLVDSSPVGRTNAPSSVSAVELCTLVAIAAVVTLAAGVIYRRRDVV